MTPADLARKWINRKQTPEDGIPSWGLVVMDVHWTERLLGEPQDSYFTDPLGFEVRQKQALRTAFYDRNKTIAREELEGGFGSAVSKEIPVLDGITIDSPDAVKKHYEQFWIPQLEQEIRSFDKNAPALREAYVNRHRQFQDRLGPDVLRVSYGVTKMPWLRYEYYGYEQYFMFYALYPELAAEALKIEADHAQLYNALLGQAIVDEGFAPLLRVGADLADSRGSLVSMQSLDEMYFPQLERAVRPLIDRNIKLLRHCDGNMTDFLPRLLDIGFAGFQGFQYELGVDYPAIAQMTTRDGYPLTLIVGASVVTTMVDGTPEDVRREIDWLVENSGDSFLALGASAAITPETPWETIDALVEAMQYYQEHGKTGLRQRVGKEHPFNP